jgi:thiamine-phosphate pyrophosphorylase
MVAHLTPENLMPPGRLRVDFFGRYNHAEVHRTVFSANDPKRPGPGFRLYGVTARQLLEGDGLENRLETLCACGLRGVQIREKDLSEMELLRLAGQCRAVFERHNTRWLINTSINMARAAGANGVQLAAKQDVAAARALMGRQALIGKSVHSLTEAKRAASGGADFVVFGPIFQTPAKAAYGSPQGLEILREVCAALECPVFAIGGVTPQKARQCREVGAYGVAVMSALMDSSRPELLLNEYRKSLGDL